MRNVGLAVSAESSRVVVWRSNRIVVLDAQNLSIIDDRARENPVARVCFYDCGTKLAILDRSDQLRLERVDDGELIARTLLERARNAATPPQPGVRSLLASDASGLIVADCGAGEAWVLDHIGEPQGRLELPWTWSRNAAPRLIAGGRFIVSASRKTLTVKDLATGLETWSKTLNGSIHALEVDPDRNLVVTGHSGGRVICWKSADGGGGSLEERWRHVHPDMFSGAPEPGDDWDRVNPGAPVVDSVAFAGKAIHFTRTTITDVISISTATGEQRAVHRVGGGGPGRRAIVVPGATPETVWCRWPNFGSAEAFTRDDEQLDRRTAGDCLDLVSSPSLGAFALSREGLTRYGHDAPHSRQAFSDLRPQSEK